MSDGLGGGGVLSYLTGGYTNRKIAKEDGPFSYDGDTIIHRKSGKVVAKGKEQCQAFFTGRQVPNQRRNIIKRHDSSP